MMQNKKYNLYDVAIIGCGPAGMTAAIYSKRANLKTIIFEKDTPGGKVVTTSVVENYPGFKSIEGPNLAFSMYEQVTNLDIEIIYQNVTNIEFDKNSKIYTITSMVNDNFNTGIMESFTTKAKAVILATGTTNRRLNIPGETEFEGKGISYCAICDGALYKNEIVSVIGSGNSAVEEAIFLAGICKKVFLISNKEQLKADELIVNQLKKNKNITVLMNKDTIEFLGDSNGLTDIKLKDKSTSKIELIKVKANFTFIGLLPSIFKNDLIDQLKDQQGFINTNENMETVSKGLYAAGDIRHKNIRQISTAINDGTIAALYVKEYIDRNDWGNGK